jgi:hypothetical protein
MSIQLRSGSLWKNVSSIKLRVGGLWKDVSSAYLRSGGAWKFLFSSALTPSIQTRVTIALSGGINASSNIMNDSNPVTITSTRFHWEDANGYTYVWQKSPDNSNWENIGTAQATTNPASGSSSSSLALTLSPSYFTSGPDMYFRFSYRATNSTYGTSASSESLSKLVSYYGTPVPIGQSPSITGSTVVGNTAFANIGTWTNSPTSYDYNVFYTSGLSVYPLTYAGVKSVSSKFLSGFSAALVTSSAHGYKTNDTVVVSGMDSLFNGSHTITARTNSTIFFTLPTPTAFSITSSVVSGTFRSFNGNAYRAISNLDTSTAWTDAGTGYSVGDNVYYNSNRYRANSSLSSVSAYSGGTFYSVGQIVYANNNRYQSKTSGNQGNSFTNTTYWTNLGSFAPGVNSMWTSVMPSNTSFWTLQSFSDEPASGTTTAPNYYEGTVSSSTSIPIPITTFDYKQGIDLRGATTSGSGAVLSFGVKAYNQATLSPSEYLGQAFIYGVPILSIGSITPSYTTASVPFTSSYISGYLLNLYTQPSITNVIGGATTVTYFAQNTFTSGQQVTITGVNPPVYNGVRTIQSATTTSFTVSANITDSYISGGTAKVTVSGYPLPVSSNASPRSITGLPQGTTYYLEITPSNNGMTGTMQTSSFTTLIQPTISNISVFNSTPSPSSASSVSVSNTAPSNSGSVSWINGANTSFANLRSVTGSGSLSTQSDPTSLSTTGSFTVISTGTANATIRAINNNKRVSVTWSQTNAQSYTIDYAIAGAGPAPLLNGNSSDSNPVVQLFSDSVARLVTVYNITVYPGLNQSGIGVTLSPPSNSNSATGANKTTDTSESGSVTYTQPATPPSGGSVSVNPTSGTAGSTTFTASPSGWSGNPTPTYSYVWSYLNNSFQWVSVGTGSTFTPSVISPTPLDWRVVLTATNSAGSAQATANFTVNNPAVIPTITMGANSNVTSSSGTINWTSTNQNSFSSNGSFASSGGSTVRSISKTGLAPSTRYTGTVTVTSSTGNTASADYDLTTSAAPVASVSSITGSTGGRTGTTFWNDPKTTMRYTFQNATSATARIQRSADNVTWTSGATESLSISSNVATQSTNQPTGNTSASANFYYRAQVISINGTTLGTPITSASFRNTVTPISNRALYP